MSLIFMFINSILATLRNPQLKGQFFNYAILGFALAEATGLLVLMIEIFFTLFLILLSIIGLIKLLKLIEIIKLGFILFVYLFICLFVYLFIFICLLLLLLFY
jgi:hypothetical protein